jgi:hypothetical protein
LTPNRLNARLGGVPGFGPTPAASNISPVRTQAA